MFVCFVWFLFSARSNEPSLRLGFKFYGAWSQNCDTVAGSHKSPLLVVVQFAVKHSDSDTQTLIVFVWFLFSARSNEPSLRLGFELPCRHQQKGD